jgi:broad specificity phosphatase PhoE
MAEDYDRLSPTGEEQARRLGRYWTSRGIVFDRVCSGPAKRHIRTAELVGDEYANAGLPWPQPVTLTEVDEIDAGYLMRSHLPVLAERDERVRVLNDAFQNGIDSPQAGELLQSLFEEIALHWCRGLVDVEGMESWKNFGQRVWTGIEKARSEGESIVVFTSGGPISATIARVLDLTPEKALEFLWMTRNCSFSEFLANNGKFSLSTYNAFPHLDEAFLLTYR